LFGSVFTKEISGEVPEADWVYKKTVMACEILISYY